MIKKKNTLAFSQKHGFVVALAGYNANLKQEYLNLSKQQLWTSPQYIKY